MFPELLRCERVSCGVEKVVSVCDNYSSHQSAALGLLPANI